MRILREKRLNQELMNGVTLTQLRDKLFQDKEFLMDNGDFCIGDKEAGTWLKEHAVVESKIERNITF